MEEKPAFKAGKFRKIDILPRAQTSPTINLEEPLLTKLTPATIKNSFTQKLHLLKNPQCPYRFQTDPVNLRAVGFLEKVPVGIIPPELASDIAQAIKMKMRNWDIADLQDPLIGHQNKDNDNNSTLSKQNIEQKSKTQSASAASFKISEGQARRRLKEKTNSGNNVLKPSNSATFLNNVGSSIQERVSYRRGFREISNWINQRLADPPKTEKECNDFKEIIMGLGMKEAIRIIKTRCEEEGNLVERIWQMTWRVCQQAILHVSRASVKLEKQLRDQLAQMQRIFGQQISHREKEISEIKSKLEVSETARKQAEYQSRMNQRANKELKTLFKQEQDNTLHFEIEFVKVLEENLVLQLGNIGKRDWVRKMYRGVQNYKAKISNQMKNKIKRVAIQRAKFEGENIDLENIEASDEAAPIDSNSLQLRLESEFSSVNHASQTDPTELRHRQIQTECKIFCHTQTSTDEREMKDQEMQTVPEKAKAQKVSMQKEAISRSGAQNMNNSKKGIIKSTSNKKENNNKQKLEIKVIPEEVRIERKESSKEDHNNQSRAEPLEDIRDSSSIVLACATDRPDLSEENNPKGSFSLSEEVPDEPIVVPKVLFATEIEEKNPEQISKGEKLSKKSHKINNPSIEVMSREILEQKSEDSEDSSKKVKTNVMDLSGRTPDGTDSNFDRVVHNTAKTLNQPDLWTARQNSNEDSDNEEFMVTNEIGMDLLSPKNDSPTRGLLQLTSRAPVKRISHNRSSYQYIFGRRNGSSGLSFSLQKGSLVRNDSINHGDPRNSQRSSDPFFVSFAQCSYEYHLLQKLQSHNINLLLKTKNNKYEFALYRELLKNIESTNSMADKKMEAAIDKTLVPHVLELLRYFKKVSGAATNKLPYHEFLRNINPLPWVIFKKFSQKYGVRALAYKHMKQLLFYVKALKGRSARSDLLYSLLFADGRHFSCDSIQVYLEIMVALDPHFSSIMGLTEEQLLFDPANEACVEKVRQITSKTVRDFELPTKKCSVNSLCLLILRDLEHIQMKKMRTMDWVILVLGCPNLRLQMFVAFIMNLRLDLDTEFAIIKEALYHCDVRTLEGRFEMSEEKFMSFVTKSSNFRDVIIDSRLDLFEKRYLTEFDEELATKIDNNCSRPTQQIIRYLRISGIQQNTSPAWKYAQYEYLRSKLDEQIGWIIGPKLQLLGSRQMFVPGLDNFDIEY